MSHPIEFFFDLVSPYSYLASKKIEELAQRNNRELIWKPFLLGGLFKALDAPPAPGLLPTKNRICLMIWSVSQNSTGFPSTPLRNFQD